MYCNGLGWSLLGQFEDHAGFDGAMVGHAEAPYHFELTTKRVGHVSPTPTTEDLVVLYIPAVAEWREACASMISVGFTEVAPCNPFWSPRGRTFKDPDGYRVVLQNSSWD